MVQYVILSDKKKHNTNINWNCINYVNYWQQQPCQSKRWEWHNYQIEISLNIFSILWKMLLNWHYLNTTDNNNEKERQNTTKPYSYTTYILLLILRTAIERHPFATIWFLFNDIQCILYTCRLCFSCDCCCCTSFSMYFFPVNWNNFC